MTHGRPIWFDFGFTAVRPRVFDLAYSLSWIVLRPDDSGRGEDFEWRDRLSTLVERYEVGAGWALTGAERRAVGPLLASVPLYLASIAAWTPDPPARITEERGFLDIAHWVLHDPEALHRAIGS